MSILAMLRAWWAKRRQTKREVFVSQTEVDHFRDKAAGMKRKSPGGL